jgi:hypothetical protein
MSTSTPELPDFIRAIGLHADGGSASTLADETRRLVRFINLKLVAFGLPAPISPADVEFTSIARGLLDRHRELSRLLAEHRCPIDHRVELFLTEHFAGLTLEKRLRLPSPTFVLERHGIARILSLPAQGDCFPNDLLTSFRVRNGVLHNPRSDRRTTKGTFHVTAGGLSIPGDKKAVPQHVFAALLQAAVNPPEPDLVLPFTSHLETPARAFVSLLLRPTVCPEVPGVTPRKTMEVRFFAPGSLVSNLDFVESIFGNAGDPYLPENDAALDVEHWTGHTGCVILAPHLTKLTKKQVGLPHFDQATERQRRDGMCWREEQELYNDGVAFKLTCRTAAGVIVTLIADNYFGYCKKEIKTQISYAANLYGNVEEEHAGGAIAFAAYNLGEDFQAESRRYNGRSFDDVIRDYADSIEIKPEGCAVDRAYPDLIYVPEDARFLVPTQTITWARAGIESSIPLLPGKVYMTPSGYKVRLEKHPGAPSWRLVGAVGEGVVCHKPCTVSGGGKSEISKSLVDYMLYGPIFVADIDKDLALIDEIFRKDYSTRWKPFAPHPNYGKRPSRSVLSPQRSLGSVIKLLTPSPDYNEGYNRWLASIPDHIHAIVFIIKRFARPEWGDDWRKHFSVDIVNGVPGHTLKYDDRRLVGTYLRVGFLGRSSWRTFKLRQDFIAAQKVQIEDDITASVVVPARLLEFLSSADAAAPKELSVKFVKNCEYRLFQRPDDAIHPGLDKQTESDFSKPDNFLSNYEPLPVEYAWRMVERQIELEAYTPPMQRFLREAADAPSGYIVSTAHPRIVDGKPTKNPRYLQLRPDVADPMSRYVAERGARLFRAIPADKPVHQPVNAVLVGRRNNPAEAGIRSLAVYNPIHYQELPELFMEFISSLTGKSPSTTGAGSEGALTKAPFNALRPTADLNAALVSYILTGLGGFSTAAGHVGPHIRVDHDISLLVPEIWCRMSVEERDPRYLIDNGYLEPLTDFEHDGKWVLASRLGYRITERFVNTFCGRLFDNPSRVFDRSILKPEAQDLSVFVDGVNNITEAQQRVAKRYFDDASVEEACPPLRALLTIMAHGAYEGKDVHDADVRHMFTREYLLESSWYRGRLRAKQDKDTALWRRHLAALEAFTSRPANAAIAARLGLNQRLAIARRELDRVSSAAYTEELLGTLGCDPLASTESSHAT